jgi:amidase
MIESGRRQGGGGSLSRRDFGRALAATAAVAPASMAWPRAQERPSRDEELVWLTATALSALMAGKRVSAREVMQAHLARIERVNPAVNAIVTLVAERALADAARADELIVKGPPTGVLHGLPVAHKDLLDTAGIRTTLGSPFYRDRIPTRDATIVTRMRAAGALTLGKTNTPEFGAGSQTFNTIFGATRNPYDISKTCGGSSGGAAVALACGMVPIADGSDMGGSLRNPAAFCNVVGFRPSPGRVPRDSSSWSPLSVSGPMARTVEDVALLLSVLAGADARSPLSLDGDGTGFRAPLDRDFKGARIAWWRDLGGVPVSAEIRRVVDGARRVFEALDCRVEQDEPDFSGVDDAFATLRYASNYPTYAPLVKERPEWVKDTIRYEVAQAERLTAADVGRAMARQTRLYDESRTFFERHDYFVLPVTQVTPFDVNTPYPTSIDGVATRSYIDWMRSCIYVTMMAAPAISVPCGFTESGLPVGLQVVGRHRGDWSVLQLAHAFERARPQKRRPAI